MQGYSQVLSYHIFVLLHFSFGIKSQVQHSQNIEVGFLCIIWLTHCPITPHNPVFLKKTKTKKLCNDLGLCGVKGNTLSRKKKKSPKTQKKTKYPGKLRVISSKTGTVLTVGDVVRRGLSFLDKKVGLSCLSLSLLRPVWNIGGVTVLWYCSPAAVCRTTCPSCLLNMDRGKEDAFALSKLIFVLFAEAIPSWEEIPAALLVHLPHIRLLESESKC